MKTLASLLLIAYLSAAAADSAEVSYEVHFTEEEMTLDGRADEQSWSLASPIELTDRAYPQPKADYPCKHESESPLERTRTLGLVPVPRPEHFGNDYQADSSVYKDDDVELFLDPDMDGTHYVQLAINALNTQMDVLKTEIDNKPSFPNWDSGTESAVVVAGSLEDGADRDESWTVELFFPWNSMGQEALELSRYYKVNESDVLGDLSVPPQVGDRWKANFNRFDHGRGEVRRTNLSWGTIRYKEGDIVSGWGVSPTSGSLHDPTHWGVLVFVK